ncbi:helix-turn-helix domain-containing protein [Iodobacter sp. CM08]|uniref:helix-turn-helix domain-containing protein n=1 Tax=Iodobacter sp. CM08 TaxID=3085902 RepID=UPI0029821113|nr:helix-turn-helix domain-containing protein [Iodobacter sp. CM08]MDW5417716.1 helix-turn-helix domain-containing protein [Iodobacter sp. CM08]
MKSYDIATAAAFLNIHPTTLSELAASGELIAAKIGRAYVFLEDDLVSYVRSVAAKQTAARRKKKAEREALAMPVIQNPVGRKNKPRPDLSAYA